MVKRFQSPSACQKGSRYDGLGTGFDCKSSIRVSLAEPTLKTERMIVVRQIIKWLPEEHAQKR
jgi:hypothetical protein